MGISHQLKPFWEMNWRNRVLQISLFETGFMYSGIYPGSLFHTPLENGNFCSISHLLVCLWCPFITSGDTTRSATKKMYNAGKSVISELFLIQLIIIQSFLILTGMWWSGREIVWILSPARPVVPSFFWTRWSNTYYKTIGSQKTEGNVLIFSQLWKACETKLFW